MPLPAERRSGGTCPRGEHPCRRSDPGQEATSSAGRRDPQGTALSSSEGTAASLPRWDAHVLLGGWTGELPSALRPPLRARRLPRWDMLRGVAVGKRGSPSSLIGPVPGTCSLRRRRPGRGRPALPACTASRRHGRGGWRAAQPTRHLGLNKERGLGRLGGGAMGRGPRTPVAAGARLAAQISVPG